MENILIPEYVIACLWGTATAEQQQQALLWLALSEANKTFYRDLLSIRHVAANTPPRAYNSAEGWTLISRQLHIPVRRKRLKLAVMILLLISLGSWYFANQQLWHTYTASGQIKDSLRLPDGSLVVLKPGTVLRYKKREVIMQAGEAFFEITRDGQHQFRIQAGTAAIQVLGTSFNVRYNQASTDVTVWDGKVQLSAPHAQPVVLSGGNMGVADKTVRKLSGNYAYRCGWANNDLSFNDQCLRTVLKELSAYYKVKFITPDTTILNRAITVRLKDTPLDEALKVISATMDIRISQQGPAAYLLSF